MPVDKNKIRRLQVLDRCFADRQKMYFWEDLREACRKALENAGMEHPDVSRRTILNDIAEMESNPEWKVDLLPIEQSHYGKRRYYRYADPTYSIWKTDLTEEQLKQLQSILLMLRQFQNFPQYDAIEDIIKQLETKYHFSLGDSEGVMAFESNENIEAMQYIGVLFSAIIAKQTLHIRYQPFGKQPQALTVSPYYLKQYNRRWFLLGRTQRGNAISNRPISNLALDRMVDVAPAAEKYIESGIDFEDYFADLMGVTNSEEKAEHIVLEFTPNRFPYVVSKPLHPSQKMVDKDKGQISITVKPTKELYQTLLSFGADVQIVSPASVRKTMQEEIEKMQHIYFPMQKGCTE